MAKDDPFQRFLSLFFIIDSHFTSVVISISIEVLDQEGRKVSLDIQGIQE